MLRPVFWLLHAIERLVYYCGRVFAHARMRRLFPGARALCDYSTVIKYPDRIRMGQDVWIGPEVSIGAMAGIVLEDRVRISHGAFIETGSLDLSGDVPYSHVGKPIHIERGVWIGAHAIVLGGVRIGRQAVVAAGALVVKDVPADAIVAGVPARVVGHRPIESPSS
jgi:acetyltransferase-like isoleucine patch superfamily enzyme